MESWRESFRRVNRKLLLGAGIALLLLALSGALTLNTTRELVRTSKRVSTIHATIGTENELLFRLNEAESGLFGYIITGEDTFLAPYHTATNQIPELVTAIRVELAGHEDAAAALNRLEPLIRRRLNLMQNRVAVRRTNSLEAAATLVRSGEAKEIMDEIRNSVIALVAHEIERLADMEQRSEDDARRTFIVTVGFGTFSLALLAIILLFLLRENVTRLKTEDELRKAGHELEMRVAARTADLARSNASLQIEIEEHRRAEEALRTSELKLAETARALAEKNKDLEMLIYVASHDLRSPLLNIRGFANELVHTCKAIQEQAARGNGEISSAQLATLLEEIPESTGFINAGAARMDTLLAGFLRLSRLGREAIRIVRLDMNELCAEVIKSFEFQLREAGATISVDRLPRCLGDMAQMTQVLSNLIDNAIKYRDPTRPLHIQIKSELSDGTVAYHVQDNGSGISPDQEERVFEMFHRANPSVCEGEGLGLAIARRSLDRQNGRISLKSEQGRGSSFTIFLPPVAERRTNVAETAT